MNVAQFPLIDRRRESAYGQCQNQKARLVAKRAHAIETLERTLTQFERHAVTEDRVDACNVMREILAELQALDPGGLDDEKVSSAVDSRLKAFRCALSNSCFRICGALLTEE